MLGARILTGAALGIAIVATLLFLPTNAVAIIFAVLWSIGAWEWAGFARLHGGVRLAYVAVFVACLLGGWAALDSIVGPGLYAVTILWWLVALLAVLTFPRRFAAGWVAAAGFLVLLPSWWLLVTLHAAPSGPQLSLTFMGIVWAADVGAYGFGRWLGRVKLAPAVSPGKTWEGVSGGVLVAVVVAVGAGQMLALPLGSVMALGATTALVSVLGDLTESLFKRNAGLKDSGSLFPGHGGVLDRFDSFTAAMPIFVIGLSWFGILA